MRTLRWILASALFAALLCVVAACSVPAKPLSATVDEFVAAELRTQHIPGVALAVVRDGKIVHAAGYGMANVELSAPTKPESIFQTGSVGKQFTATAVMMVVEEGKIGLDDKISKYFPNAPAAWKDIAVRHLLTHTSGIPDYTGGVGVFFPFWNSPLITRHFFHPIPGGARLGVN